MSQEEPADTDPVATFSDRKVYADGRIRLPGDLRDEHGLEDGTVVDLRVVQEDRSASIMDAEITSDGRVQIPERKRRLYGINCGGYVSGAIEEVVRR